MAKKKRTFFPHLHAHDENSIKDGCSTVETYADLVVGLGGESLAVTNHGMASGYARQYYACKERGIKPIFGMEAYINEHRLKPIRELNETLKKQKKSKKPGATEKLERVQKFIKEKFRPSPHSIILAATREGYRNLVRMSTDSWLNGFYYSPRTDTKFLADHAEGLVYSTACIGGYIPRMAREDWDGAVKEAKRLQKIFETDGSGFYVELMITEYSKQRETNLAMMRLAHEIGAPMIITCDVHYARPADGLAQDVLLLMRDKKTIKDKEAGEGGWQFEAKDLWWRSLEHVAATWKKCHSDYMDKETFLQAIRNTYALADRIEAFDFDESLKLPGVFDRPEERLKQLAIEGLRWRDERGSLDRSGKSKRDYVERIRHELNVINQKGFAEYFLILHDICRHAREINALTGPGRGSAGGSLIAYLLRITQIDPLRFGLLFERFLDVTRSDPPDIDLDFSPEHRDKIKQYIQKRYPATATIGTYSTFKPRATLQDVGRVFNIDYKTMQKITKPLGNDADKLSWEKIFELWPAVEEWAEENPDAFHVARTLKGMISHRGKNAAGVLIAPASALDDLPMIKDPGDGTICTAFPDSQGDGVTYKGRELSRLGYLKMDILGVRNLNVHQLAVEILNRDAPEDYDEEALPIDDPGPLDDAPTLEEAATGDIPGTFQLDTAVTRPILRHVGVDRFMDLCMITALARPGPLKHDVHKTYAKLKRSGRGWQANVPHPDLIPLLADSLGLMILQEDVMFVVQKLGGLSMAEANQCRKIIGKKMDKAAFKPWEEKFVAGGLERGYDEEALRDTWTKIVTFAGYGFNKSHAVAYMVTAYRQIYMLRHHPLHYFAATLAHTPRGKGKGKGEEAITRYMRAALKREIQILPPDLVKSGANFDTEGESIRYGLSKVKGVASAADAILEARPFSTLEEFFSRVEKRRCNSRVVSALITVGAADGLDFEGREELEADFPMLSEDEQLTNLRNGLFARYHALRGAKGEPDQVGITTIREKEKELLGMALSWWASNTKDRLREAEHLLTIAEAIEDDRSHLALLVEITRVKTHKTKRGLMAFVTVSDETGDLDNLIVWADQWERYRSFLVRGKVVVMYLKREESRDRSYGKWSYKLDTRNRKAESVVEPAARALRRIS